MTDGHAGDDEGETSGPAPAVAVHRGPEPFPHTVRIREHELLADEPPAYGGRDTGPDPTELLAAALASCTSMTVRSYAERKGWELDGMTVQVAFVEDGGDGRPSYAVTLDLPDGLEETQARRLAAIALKCPVRRALTAGAAMQDEVRHGSQPATAQARR